MVIQRSDDAKAASKIGAGQALAAGVDILTQARRPLVVFPEGVISRHNDRLNALIPGTAFMARPALRF